MNESERIYRAVVTPLEVRGDDGAMTIEGYAANWDEYQLWHKYHERIAGPEAFAGSDMADVILRYDHTGKVLARNSNGTLTITPDDKGLKVSADLSKSQAARDTYEEIKAGLITKMSWAFTVGKEHEEREYDDDGNTAKVLRVIDHISKVYDVSPVSIPANDKTVVSARSWIDGAIERDRRSDLRRKRLALRIRINKEKGTKNESHTD
jgi:HK97 family phage prohead protease